MTGQLIKEHVTHVNRVRAHEVQCWESFPLDVNKEAGGLGSSWRRESLRRMGPGPRQIQEADRLVTLVESWTEPHLKKQPEKSLWA